MEKIVVDVPGKPLGKARPRVTRRGITYTPKPTAEREKLVRMCFTTAHPGITPAECPLAVTITAVYPVPVSAPAKKRAQMAAGEIFPTTKPDADNVAKLALDALNGVAYRDDSQVVSLLVTKRYARPDEAPHTLVELSPFGQ